MIDTLIEGIKRTKSPICVGLETMHTYLPDTFQLPAERPMRGAAHGIYEFNREIIDAVADIVPAVKVQVAYYEQYGSAGMRAFQKTIAYAKKVGLVVIADVKRNDIGSTAAAYSAAYLGGVQLNGERQTAFDADFVTVNPYLGTDGIAPFLADCEKFGKGIFVLVKTSNPSGGEFQDLKINRRTLYARVADKVAEWGAPLMGEYGYSSVGAVVGATYPEEAAALRRRHRHMFFLVPGYGAQGAGADDIAVNFDGNGLGAIVNSSRGILLAYRQPGYGHMHFKDAARAAAIDMREDIRQALARRGAKL